MNIALWVIQVLLALHTITGAVWKFSHSAQAVPSLQAIPHAGWLGLSLLELACSVALLLPALVKSAGKWPPVAAAIIAAEMLLFTAVHFASGATEHGEVVYWLVVAAVCAFVAWGRWVLKPLGGAVPRP